MNKTIRMITAAILSLCMLAAASCSKKEPDNTPASSSAAQTTAAATTAPADTDAPASSETGPAPVIADNEQLEILFNAKKEWFSASDPELIYYITDLDMNGLYEISVSKMGESLDMYEVKADKSGVEMVDNPFSSDSSPEMDEVYELRLNSQGKYEYIAREYDDALGPESIYIYYWKLSFSDGKLDGDIVASEIHESDGKVRYGDDEYEMTKDEFDKVTNTSLPKVTYRMRLAKADGKALGELTSAKDLEKICFKIEK